MREQLRRTYLSVIVRVSNSAMMICATALNSHVYLPIVRMCHICTAHEKVRKGTKNFRKIQIFQRKNSKFKTFLRKSRSFNVIFCQRTQFLEETSSLRILDCNPPFKRTEALVQVVQSNLSTSNPLDVGIQ